MYVPGLRLKRITSSTNIVQMIASTSSAVGTTSYIISKKGVETLLDRHAQFGFTEAIPNIMAICFPNTRFAAFPMIFHRAGKVTSLVNPQLDDFRRIMFNPALYTLWERLMVYTEQTNNTLFPTVLLSLVISVLIALFNALDVLVLHPRNALVNNDLF